MANMSVSRQRLLFGFLGHCYIWFDKAKLSPNELSCKGTFLLGRDQTYITSKV